MSENHTAETVERMLYHHEFVTIYRREGVVCRKIRNGWSHWAHELQEGYEVNVPTLGKVTKIESVERGYSDGEGPISMAFSVTSGKGETRFFRKDGFYESYDGTVWDGPFVEIRKVTKTVEVFEEV
jgi:hypothetical protein